MPHIGSVYIHWEEFLFSSVVSVSKVLPVVLAVRPGEYGPLNFKGSFGNKPTPFTVDVDPTFIERTKLKASLTRPAIELNQPQFVDGVSSQNITALANFIAHDYDFFAFQKKLNNEFKHFTTTIPSLNSTQFNYTEPIPLHFIHHRSSREDAIPLIFIHGWPGSFLEVQNILPGLLEPDSADQPAFHVVAPSLPGYGFSPAPTKPGMGLKETAAAFNQLMLQLNYTRYVAQGGDFGAFTSRYLASMFPENAVSILSNLYSVSPTLEDLSRYAANQTSAEETAFIQYVQATEGMAKAFWGIESLLPLQVGFLLGDSPVGNIAWSYFGMKGLTPGYDWTIEELVNWGMMLYIQGPYNSVRMYTELTKEGTLDFAFDYINNPVGVLEYFPDAMYGAPEDWCKRSANVTYFVKKGMTVLGGHFPAHVNPTDLADEMRKFWGSAAGGWTK
ncbi:Alpha/Beta hydrolase protein [Flagelloscypha sp. PMI_526]|nr:Alpha/Beta hydrolase protein [Flagelloscypha sp. PMI_526]